MCHIAEMNGSHILGKGLSYNTLAQIKFARIIKGKSLAIEYRFNYNSQNVCYALASYVPLLQGFWPVDSCCRMCYSGLFLSFSEPNSNGRAMFLNTNEVDTRMLSGRNIADRIATEIVEERGGLISRRTFDSRRIDDEMRPVIGLVASLTSTRAAAETFGISNNTANRFDHENQAADIVEKMLAPVRKSAIDKISMCLGKVTEEKLQDLSAKSLSEVARNISSVVRNTAPREVKEDSSKYQLTVIAPAVKRIGVFDVSDV